MRYFIAALSLVFLASCNTAERGPVITFATLSDQMTDLGRLAELDGPAYRTVQYSSYDRRSKTPNDSCWFSNEDGFGNEPIPAFEEVLRQPDSTGTGEYLICDINQPGAIVRLWTAGLNGNIRLWLDNAEKPFYEGDAQDFFWKTAEVLAGLGPEDSELLRQFDATYFPIPFGKHCRLEWTGDISKIHFYHVGVRLYEPGTQVETFSKEEAEDLRERLGKLNKTFNNPDSSISLNGTAIVDLPEIPVADSSSAVIYSSTGSGKIVNLTLKLSGADYESMLRHVLLEICFDGSSVPQVRVPAGDFFGAAPGLNPFESLPLSVRDDGTMTCRFVMPYKHSVRITLQNYAGESIMAKGTLNKTDYTWRDGISMHFRARWKMDYGLTAATFDEGSNGVQDLIYLMAAGKGRLAGSAAFIYNPSAAVTSWGNWWGEGDEKIFVDHDTFPSFFGTGSEDYFNYSWSAQRIFSYPYCGQPRNDGPGNRGYVSDFRWHVLDDIPFSERIAFYMELGHHGIVPDFAYGRLVYYYALPGSADDYKKIFSPDLHPVEYKEWHPIAYLGSAGYTFFEAEKLIHQSKDLVYESDPLCSGGTLVLWTTAGRNDKFKFNLVADSASENSVIGFTMLHSPDGGSVAVQVNGGYVNFDGNGSLSLFEPGSHILVNHFSAPVGLKKGKNEIVIENLDEAGRRKIGIDFIWLK